MLIEYDPDRSENHGGQVLVDTVPDVNVIVAGITKKVTALSFITVAAQIEDVMENEYQAYLVDTNQVLLVLPSTPRIMRRALAHLHRQAQESFGQLVPREREYRDMNMNAVQNDPSRQKTLLLIDCGDNELTNIHFSPNSQDGRINMEFTPVQNFYQPAGMPMMSHTTTVVTFKVSVAPMKDRIVDQQVPVNDNVGLLQQMMMNANLGAPNAGGAVGQQPAANNNAWPAGNANRPRPPPPAGWQHGGQQQQQQQGWPHNVQGNDPFAPQNNNG